MDLRTFLGDLSLARPEALYLLAIPAVVLLWSLINARGWIKIWAPLMRAIALALFVVAIANPEKVMRSEGAAQPALIDASASITPEMRSWTAHLLKEELRLRPGDPAFMFASVPIAKTIAGIESGFAADGCSECGPNHTSLEVALARLAADPEAEGAPAVLMTDGWENLGDATRAINALYAAHIRLDIFTLRAPVRSQCRHDRVNPAAGIGKAEPFALGVTMDNFNPHPVSGTISVYRVMR